MEHWHGTKRHWRLLMFLLLGGMAVPTWAQDYKAILASPERKDDVALDAGRKPEAVLQFLGVKPGDKVADILAGRGYYTAIPSQVVGSQGVVYSANNAMMKGFVKDALDVRLKDPMFANVKHIDGEVGDLALPTDGSLDFVLIHLNYHDLVGKNDDREALNKVVFKALKPGGVYGVVDHYAKDGSGGEAAGTLHRVDKALVIKEVTDAGFVLAKEGEMLRHPEDPRTEGVFKDRGNTDRFVLRFEKPK